MTDNAEDVFILFMDFAMGMLTTDPLPFEELTKLKRRTVNKNILDQLILLLLVCLVTDSMCLAPDYYHNVLIRRVN